jgi:phage gp29-like protein
MGLFDIFKAKKEPTTTEAKRIKKMTAVQQMYRFNQELNSWKNGVIAFEDEYNSTTVDLIRVYNDIVIDAHLTAAIENRISHVLSKDFKICDESDNEIDIESDIFEAAWFRDFIRYAIESKFYGYSLIQLGNRKEKTFEDVTIIPREYVYPQRKSVRKSPYDTQALIPFNEGEYEPWLIGIGKPDSLGLLMKAAPLVIFKKTALGSWTEFAELFGTPFRMGKTNVRDEELRDNMFQMLQDMGRNAFGVFDTDDVLEFVRDNKTDSHHVFNELIDRVNSELSKLILGSTMIMDDGSSRSQAEVHQSSYDAIIKDDLYFIENLVNNVLIPHLNKFHNFNIKGHFEFDNAENLSKSDQFKIDLELLKLGFDIPIDYLSATYGTPIDAKPTPTEPKGTEKKKSI